MEKKPKQEQRAARLVAIWRKAKSAQRTCREEHFCGCGLCGGG